MIEVFIYGVYDGDQLIYTGSKREICDKFDIKACSMNSYIYDGIRLKGKYYVKKLGSEYRDVGREPKRVHRKIENTPDPDYSNAPLETLIRLLKINGNTTVSSFDPYIYLDDLKKEGIAVKISLVADHTAQKRVTKRGRKPKVRYNYLVEVIDATSTSKSIQERIA